MFYSIFSAQITLQNSLFYIGSPCRTIILLYTIGTIYVASKALGLIKLAHDLMALYSRAVWVSWIWMRTFIWHNLCFKPFLRASRIFAKWGLIKKVGTEMGCTHIRGRNTRGITVLLKLVYCNILCYKISDLCSICNVWKVLHLVV